MNKSHRYKNIFKTVVNWKHYLLMKSIGFKKSFSFDIVNFGQIKVEKSMMGPFRENFFDDVYFKHIPEAVYKNKTNPVIIDIGANVGYFSLATFAKFPGAEIYSFEPHPYCFEVMSDYKQSFEQFNWNVFQEAVSDQNGSIFLNTQTVSGFTTMASVFENAEKKERFLAKTIQLDTFLSEKGINNIDVMKFDCEGAEYSIIYSLLEESFAKINSMCIEAHRGDQKSQNINSLNKYLVNKGYTTEVLPDGNSGGYIWAWKTLINQNFPDSVSLQ
jgi:FkbM family methyltransferase